MGSSSVPPVRWVGTDCSRSNSTATSSFSSFFIVTGSMARVGFSVTDASLTVLSSFETYVGIGPSVGAGSSATFNTVSFVGTSGSTSVT